MAVEVRELVIKCEVREPDGPRRDAVSPAALRAWRHEVLRECQRRIEKALRRSRER